MFLRQRSPNYVAEIERIGADSLARFRAKETQKEVQVDRYRELALTKLKLLAVEQAIVVERLKWPYSGFGPRLDDPSFERKIQDTAAELLFQAHLHLSVTG